jgi:tetratricopeptide (TPR) repeat protein
MKATVQNLEAVRAMQPSRFPRRSRRRLRLVIGLAVLVLLLLSTGGYLLLRPRVQPLSLPTLPAHLSVADLGLAGWQDYRLPLPKNALSDPALPSSPRVRSSIALLEDAAGQSLIRQGQLKRGLAYMQAAAQSDPDNLRYSNDYRLALRDHGLYTEEEVFFSQQAQRVRTATVAINLALAYVDEMRSCPRPPDGLVCQAQDSYRSISVLTGVLTQHPYNIIARYARGLNNLYWPTLMGHLPQAQVDLEYSVALLRPLGSISGAFAAQAYTALGDVFAKDGQIEKARNVWLNGMQVVPNSAILSSRLSIPQGQLVNQEDAQLRGLGVPVETDLSIFWQARG